MAWASLTWREVVRVRSRPHDYFGRCVLLSGWFLVHPCRAGWIHSSSLRVERRTGPSCRVTKTNPRVVPWPVLWALGIGIYGGRECIYRIVIISLWIQQNAFINGSLGAFEYSLVLLLIRVKLLIWFWFVCTKNKFWAYYGHFVEK